MFPSFFHLSAFVSGGGVIGLWGTAMICRNSMFCRSRGGGAIVRCLLWSSVRIPGPFRRCRLPCTSASLSAGRNLCVLRSASPVVVVLRTKSPVVRACLRSGGFSSEGALNRVSAAAGTFTLKKLECSERAVQACIR